MAHLKTKKNLIKISSLFIGGLMLSSLSAWAENVVLEKALTPSLIYGHQPYMNSIGTIIYRADTEGNRGAIDENGRRVPTVGSIIGFKDLFCGSDFNKTQSPMFDEKWKPFFDYNDSDEDVCDISNAHKVEWYIIDTPDIATITSWKEIEAQAKLISSSDTNSIIAPKSIFEYAQSSIEGGSQVTTIPISGDVTTSLRIPAEAEGKYIGVRYIPLSATGLPIEGSAVEMWDLNYFYGQQPPLKPGIVGKDKGVTGLETVKKGENEYVYGSGGGKVSPATELPMIDKFTISGIMSPGQTLNLSYDFYPYPVTQPSLIDGNDDQSIFVWGDRDTFITADGYNEHKSLAENIATASSRVKITQGKEVNLTLDDVGTFFEVSALPIRKTPSDKFSVAGLAKTYLLSDHSDTIEPLQRPSVSNLRINGLPLLGQFLSASYVYSPSNSTKSYDNSYYRWSYDSKLDGKIVNTLISDGYVETDENAIPDYTQARSLQTKEPITRDQIGGEAITPEFTGNTIRLSIQARDGLLLTGNQQEDDTAPKFGVANDMFGIKLVAYNYGGSFPITRTYGEGYPSTGFAGAQFQLFAESFDKTINETNWTWDVVENKFYATVDKAGIVTLLRIPPKDSVIRVTARNKADPLIVRSHSFKIDKWLVSFRELSSGANWYPLADAGQLCQNYKKNVTEVFLPAVEDFTSLKADPNNPLQSLGARTRAPGWNTIYTFPSADFYSQWGELDVYYALDPATGALSNRIAFQPAGTPYAWTRSFGGENQDPIFAAPTGWADWFVTENRELKLNTACIAYADNFDPELPPITESHMRGIKLPYTGYPRNNSGFEPMHEYGKGFPSVGFHGAKFILFAEDAPGSTNFITNNTSGNSKWQWQITGSTVATKTAPSKNAYAFVTHLGEVVLLSAPSKGTVIEVTATNGSRVLSHTFSIDKWLYSYADLGASQSQTLAGAQNVCSVNQMRLPTVEEYTAMPKDPKNAEQSLGFGTRESGGWSIIYDFPSADYYSQWGELDIYYRYNTDLTAINGVWAFNDYWSSSLTQGGKPITTRNSGWGDWLGFTGNVANTNLYFACIKGTEIIPPKVENVTLVADFEVNNLIKASYAFIKGNNNTDKSTYTWLVDSSDTQFSGTVSTSGMIEKEAFVVTQESVGKVISLRITPKDGLDIVGEPIISTNTVSYQFPQIINPKVNGGNITSSKLTADYQWSGSNSTDKSNLTWTSKSKPAGVMQADYTVASGDLNGTVSLVIEPIDGNGIKGEPILLKDAVTIISARKPDAIDLKFLEAGEDGVVPIAEGLTLTGLYTYQISGSKNPVDASLFQWKVGTSAIAPFQLVPESGRTEPYVIKAEDAGKKITFYIQVEDQSGVKGTTTRSLGVDAATPPDVIDLKITNETTLSFDEILTGSYTFAPGFNTNLTDKSTYSWYRSGTTAAIISGTVSATAPIKPYKLGTSDSGKVISLDVIPKNGSTIMNTGVKKHTEITLPRFPVVTDLKIEGKLMTADPLKGTYVFEPASTGPADKSEYRWNNGEWFTISETGKAGEYPNFTWDKLNQKITLEVQPIGEQDIKGKPLSVSITQPRPAFLTSSVSGVVPKYGDLYAGSVWNTDIQIHSAYVDFINNKYGKGNWDIGLCENKSNSINFDSTCSSYKYFAPENMSPTKYGDYISYKLPSYTVPNGYVNYVFYRHVTIRNKFNSNSIFYELDQRAWYADTVLN